MATPPFEYFVDDAEAAKFLGITTRRLQEMARNGTIPAHPLDPNAERKDWRYLLSELAAWMLGNSVRKFRK